MKPLLRCMACGIVGTVAYFAAFGGVHLRTFDFLPQILQAPQPAVVFAYAGPSGAAMAGQGPVQQQQQVPAGLTAQLSADREDYLLGEKIMLKVRIINQSSAPIAIRKVSNVGFGLLWLEVALESGGFRRYIGPQFDTKAALIPLNPLEPGETISISFSALYNVASKQAEDLPTYYAFDKPGTYLLRTELIDIVPGQRFYSDPIKIRVEAPRGVDATVWKLLQTQEAAYFLHFGYPLTPSTDVREFEQILERYSMTAYSSGLKAGLEKYRALPARPAVEQKLMEAQVREVNSRALMVRAAPDMPAQDRDAAARALVALVDAWVKASNAQDVATLAESFSPQTMIRKLWDKGAGNLNHTTILDHFTHAVTHNGKISLEIVRITFAEGIATVNLLANAERNEIEPFQVIKCVLENGSWRILEAPAVLTF